MTYPKWKHCTDGTSLIVENEAQEALLIGGGEWSDTPLGPVDGPVDAVAEPEGVHMTVEDPKPVEVD